MLEGRKKVEKSVQKLGSKYISTTKRIRDMYQSTTKLILIRREKNVPYISKSQKSINSKSDLLALREEMILRWDTCWTIQCFSPPLSAVLSLCSIGINQISRTWSFSK